MIILHMDSTKREKRNELKTKQNQKEYEKKERERNKGSAEKTHSLYIQMLEHLFHLFNK